jgi:hypothetical protein
VILGSKCQAVRRGCARRALLKRKFRLEANQDTGIRHRTVDGRGSDKHLVLDLDVREGMRLREQQCDFLEPFFFRSILAGAPASAP